MVRLLSPTFVRVFRGTVYDPKRLHKNELQSLRGLDVPHLYFHSFGAPAVGDGDGVCASQAVAAAGDMAINGALASGGAVEMDAPRTVRIDSNTASNTTQTATVYGTDLYGEAMAESIDFNGTTSVSGAKAFATVTRVAVSAALAGTGNVGTLNRFGLPIVMASREDAIATNRDGDAQTGIITPAVTLVATATTGDVRGTMLPSNAPNGSARYGILYRIANNRSRVAVFGVEQWAG